MARLFRLIRTINLCAGTVSGVFIFAMAFVVTYEVVMRYFGAPTTWVLETSVYLNIASIFLAGSLAMQEKMHIMVDVVTRHLSLRNQYVLELVCLVASFVFCAILGWKGVTLVARSIQMGEVSATTLHTPMAIPYSFVPIGSFLLLLELFRQIITRLTELKRLVATDKLTRHGLAESLPVILFLASTGASILLLSAREFAWIGVVALLFLFIFGGMPIVFATGLIGLLGLYVTFGGGPIVDQSPVIALRILDDFVVAAIPLFVMLAMILNIGQIGSLLFEVASSFVRHLPGGMGIATMLSIAIFSAISGSTSSTVATFSLIAVPEMVRRGYDKTFCYGIVATGAVLDPLIPPSILMILIGSITGDSVGALYLAGVFPGILIGVVFSVYIVIRSWSDKAQVRIARASWGERGRAIQHAFWGLLAPGVILGGIYTGIFTPTESAAIGVLYSLFICAFVYKTLSPAKLWEIILAGGKLSCIILYIAVGALMFGQIVLMLRLPDDLLRYVSALEVSPMIILWATLGIILVLGALMDEASILFITWPILYHVFVKGFGFDPIWFSVVFLVTLEVGLVAPPVGMNIFVLQGVIKEAKFDEVVKGVLPFLYLMIGSIFVIVYLKPLSTWLPGLLFKW